MTETHRPRLTHTVTKYGKEVAQIASCHAPFMTAIALGVVLVSAALNIVAPIFLADLAKPRVVSSAKWSLAYPLAIFLFLRLLGGLLVQARWIVVNPVIYKLLNFQTENYCNLLTSRFNLQRHRWRDKNESAVTAAQFGQFQQGSVSILYTGLTLIFPTILEVSLAIIALTATISWEVSLSFTIGCGLYTGCCLLFQGKENRQNRLAVSSEIAAAEKIAETLSSIQLLHEMDRGNFIFGRLRKSLSELYNAHLQLFVVRTYRGGLRELATCCLYFLSVGMFVLLPTFSSSGPEKLIILISYLDRVMIPLTSFSTGITTFFSGLVSVHVFFDFMKERDENFSRRIFSPIAISGRLMSARFDGRVVIEQDSGHLVLDARTRIKGASGAGKSTFLHWLYEELRESECLPKVHYLSDRPDLLSGTVSENLTLNSDACDGEQALKLLEIWGSSKNRNLNMLGDVLKLSNGEMQFLALVRSILRNPDVLILDEALNSIDVTTRGKIITFLDQSLKRTSVIVVSHSSGPVFSNEKILAIEDLASDCLVKSLSDRASLT